eukprot:g15683.t1
MSNWTDNGKRQLSCVQQDGAETFINWGLYTQLKLMVETKDGKRLVKMPDNKTYNLDEDPNVGETPGSDQFATFEPESRIEIRCGGNQATAQLAVAASLYDSDILMAAVLGLKAKNSVGIITPVVPDEYVLLARCIVVFHGMLVDVVKDNFVRFLVTGQQDWSTLFLGSPQIQCAELLQDYIQWLVRGGGARFFNSWRKPAEDYIRDQQNTCDSKDRC